MYFYCCAVILNSCECSKLLNVHVLELYVKCITILTASMGTSVEQYRSRNRRMPYHMFNRDGFLPCVAKCVLLDNIERNSGHVKKWWATFRLHPVACKLKWMMWRAIQALQYLITPDSVSAGGKSTNWQRHSLVNVGKQCTVCCKLCSPNHCLIL